MTALLGVSQPQLYIVTIYDCMLHDLPPKECDRCLVSFLIRQNEGKMTAIRPCISMFPCQFQRAYSSYIALVSIVSVLVQCL